MELADAMTHVASGAGGVVGMGFIAKVLIQRWIGEQDTKARTVTTSLGKLADSLTAVVVELGKIGVKLEGLQRSADASVRYGEAIAVLQAKVEDLKGSLNGLGQKVRNLGNGA